jgi:hypothetical protein
MVCCAPEGKSHREDSMRIRGKTVAKSSHDFILIVGAIIAIAMLVSKMVHSWRTLPPTLGMGNEAVMLADSRVLPH